MAPSPLAWLLCLASSFHLCTLLAGQQLGVSKCSHHCEQMTSPIPVKLLSRYEWNEESCQRRAIILTTIRNRKFCADPKEKWVQDTMEHLNRKAPDGKFEKQIDKTVTTGITPATRGWSPSTLAEPEASAESLTLEMSTISQEARRPMGTSQEPPAAVTESSPSTSQAQDVGFAARSQGTGSFEVAAISTTIWQSSATYQSGSSLWAEETATESPSTTAPSTQAPTTTSHSTPEEDIGSEGQPPWIQGQSPSPGKSLGPEEMDPAHTEASQDRGPGNTVHPSVAPITSEGTPSQELAASGSWAPKAEEPIHATADPQKLSVLITAVPDSQAATRRQAVGLLAFLGLLFCLGVAMFAYQSLQGCPRKMAGEMVEGLRYVPRSCGSNSYVLVPV